MLFDNHNTEVQGVGSGRALEKLDGFPNGLPPSYTVRDLEGLAVSLAIQRRNQRHESAGTSRTGQSHDDEGRGAVGGRDTHHNGRPKTSRGHPSCELTWDETPAARDWSLGDSASRLPCTISH
jgi:hypothetical protein